MPAEREGNERVAQAEKEVYVPGTPETFIHDAEGNLTQDGHWAYTWDANNRLIAMESHEPAYTAGAPREKLEFAYDSQGRRFSKKVYQWNLDAWELSDCRLFIYDGWNLIAELDGGNLEVKNTYYWGNDISGSKQGAGGVSGLLGIAVGRGEILLPIYDGNGNVEAYITPKVSNAIKGAG